MQFLQGSGSAMAGTIPERFSIQGEIGGNTISQLAVPSQPITGTAVQVVGDKRRLEALLLATVAGEQVRVIGRGVSLPNQQYPTFAYHRAHLPKSTEIGEANWSEGNWLYPAPFLAQNLTDAEATARCTEVVLSWREQFFYKEERIDDQGNNIPGLRAPQLGAIHAALAHWHTSSTPATIVLPTGTGKTETMLALAVVARTNKLVVVVPSDALRTQIGEKFITFGKLKDFSVIGPSALYPIVTQLAHLPTSVAEVQSLWVRSNIIVTTMPLLSQCTQAIRDAIAAEATHLFIDEAHHVAADTWAQFKASFGSKPILQFTATPFREDGKPVEGKVIFSYPLKRAQAEGFFTRINFRPVLEFDPAKSDEAIAEQAIGQLNADLAQGYDHLVMARTWKKTKAAELVELYTRLAPQHNPQVIHSGMSVGAKKAALAALLSRQSRIIVCIDMLGEGFDLPALKIAALHSVHKSLAITLQFMGRFTRSSGTNLGTATAVANLADATVDERLEELYSEDADWNDILQNLSSSASAVEIRSSEFLEGFGDETPEISLQNLLPTMSTTIYRTSCQDWTPNNVGRFSSGSLAVGPFINHQEHTLVAITRHSEPVAWGNIKDVRDVIWHLYIVHWDAERNLLYINSSNNDHLHEGVARSVTGNATALISGEDMFRPLSGINRFLIHALSLKEHLGQDIQWSMHVGLNVANALRDAIRSNKIKSHLFGDGYQEGMPVTLGCSQKGRVWSRRTARSIPEWLDWCRYVSGKITDASIDTSQIFEQVIVPVQISNRPGVVPISILWHENVHIR